MSDPRPIADHRPCCGDGFSPTHGLPDHDATYVRTCVACRMTWPCDAAILIEERDRHFANAHGGVSA